MKRLIIIMATLIALVSCSKDAYTEQVNTPEDSSISKAYNTDLHGTIWVADGPVRINIDPDTKATSVTPYYKFLYFAPDGTAQTWYGVESEDQFWRSSTIGYGTFSGESVSVEYPWFYFAGVGNTLRSAVVAGKGKLDVIEISDGNESVYTYQYFDSDPSKYKFDNEYILLRVNVSVSDWGSGETDAVSL